MEHNVLSAGLINTNTAPAEYSHSDGRSWISVRGDADHGHIIEGEVNGIHGYSFEDGYEKAPTVEDIEVLADLYTGLAAAMRAQSTTAVDAGSPLLTPQEVAAKLGGDPTETTIRRLIEARVIDSTVMDDGTHRMDDTQVEAMLDYLASAATRRLTHEQVPALIAQMTDSTRRTNDDQPRP